VDRTIKAFKECQIKLKGGEYQSEQFEDLAKLMAE